MPCVSPVTSYVNPDTSPVTAGTAQVAVDTVRVFPGLDYDLSVFSPFAPVKGAFNVCSSLAFGQKLGDPKETPGQTVNFGAAVTSWGIAQGGG
jgi:hypothetical protein